MSVKLSADLEQRVAEHLRRRQGQGSAEAFVARAVESMIEADEAEAASLEEIRRRVGAAEREIAAGKFAEYDERTIGDLARDIHERGLKRLRGR